MAGDWIKMRINLVSHPKVLQISELLAGDSEYQEWSTMGGFDHVYGGSSDDSEREFVASLRVTRYVTVAALLRFWGYANEHSRDEFISSLRVHDIDDIVQVPGFGAALETVEWVKYDAERRGVFLPNFNEFNTVGYERSASAKSAAQRQREYRERKKSHESDVTSDVTNDVTRNRREEKRREEEIPLTPKGEPEGFTEFWEEWPASPRKQSRGKCLDAWKKAKAEAVAQEVRAHVQDLKTSHDWTKNGGEFIPAPLVYLNQRRWEGASSSTPSNPLQLFGGV